MRFDDFVTHQHIAVLPADRFGGLAVHVAMPPDWMPVDAADGVRIWIWLNDPCRDDFCANAVLTMHRIEAALDSGEAFVMLCEQQRRSVPNCRELHRARAVADDGPGDTGTLVLRIDHERGTVDSVTTSRIVTFEQETLIAQLTVTALHDSSIDLAHNRLSVAADESPDASQTVHYHGGRPATGTREEC